MVGVYDSLAIRGVVGIPMNREDAPHTSTVLRLPRLREHHELTRGIFNRINAHLQQRARGRSIMERNLSTCSDTAGYPTGASRRTPRILTDCSTSRSSTVRYDQGCCGRGRAPAAPRISPVTAPLPHAARGRCKDRSKSSIGKSSRMPRR